MFFALFAFVLSSSLVFFGFVLSFISLFLLLLPFFILCFLFFLCFPLLFCARFLLLLIVCFLLLFAFILILSLLLGLSSAFHPLWSSVVCCLLYFPPFCYYLFFDFLFILFAFLSLSVLFFSVVPYHFPQFPFCMCFLPSFLIVFEL